MVLGPFQGFRWFQDVLGFIVLERFEDPGSTQGFEYVKIYMGSGKRRACKQMFDPQDDYGLSKLAKQGQTLITDWTN